jgi:hypothetical protein
MMPSTDAIRVFEDAEVGIASQTPRAAALGTSMMLRLAGNRTFENAKTGHRVGIGNGVRLRHSPDAVVVAQPHVRGRGSRTSR